MQICELEACVVHSVQLLYLLYLIFCEENTCALTESDSDLVVEYEEQSGARAQGEGEDQSLSDSNTMNQDEDSFSILEGDSLLEPEAMQLDMPPLFVHVTCSVNVKSSHGSMPVQTLPTCLGECRTAAQCVPRYFCYSYVSVVCS